MKKVLALGAVVKDPQDFDVVRLHPIEHAERGAKHRKFTAFCALRGWVTDKGVLGDERFGTKQGDMGKSW